MRSQCRYDPNRLAGEWKEARWGAVAPFLSNAWEEDEREWIRKIRPSDRHAVLGGIFEAGKKLGAKVREWLGEEPSLGEIVYLLSHAEIYCFQGKWAKGECGLASKLCRNYCPFVKGEFDCDYWREAGRGLVTGLSDSVAYTRHESIGHEGVRCVDMLYQWPALERKYGPIPKPVSRAMGRLVEDLNRWQVTLELVGYNEGTLYVRLLGRHYPVCGSCHKLVISELLKALHSAEPHSELSEISSAPELPGAGPTRTNPGTNPYRTRGPFAFLRELL